LGVEREMIIYKQEGTQWVVWKRSKQALLGSRDGGVMGDPFGSIAIEDGHLIIHQNSGSSWKWAYTDKYRFKENDFYLVEYVSISGKPCEYWFAVDYSLGSGLMNVKKEYENCEDSEQGIYKKENEIFHHTELKVSFQNRREREIKVLSPKYHHLVYISVVFD
jgi:hypothetical protein